MSDEEELYAELQAHWTMFHPKDIMPPWAMKSLPPISRKTRARNARFIQITVDAEGSLFALDSDGLVWFYSDADEQTDSGIKEGWNQLVMHRVR